MAQGGGRPRSAESRRLVLESAYDILVEAGLAGFSVESVAARSGVPRSTIYRWWPTKGLLALESFREVFAAELSFTSTGEPDRDLRLLVRSLAKQLSGPAGRLAASVIAEAQQDPVVQLQFRTQFSEPLRAQSTELLEAGITAKRFRADLSVPHVIDAFVGATYLKLLIGLDPDEAWADALADTLLSGCLA